MKAKPKLNEEQQIFFNKVVEEPENPIPKGIFADRLEEAGDRDGLIWRALAYFQTIGLFKYGIGQTVYMTNGKKARILGYELYFDDYFNWQDWNVGEEKKRIYQGVKAYYRISAAQTKFKNLREENILAGSLKDLKHEFAVGDRFILKGGGVSYVYEVESLNEIVDKGDYRYDLSYQALCPHSGHAEKIYQSSIDVKRTKDRLKRGML